MSCQARLAAGTHDVAVPFRGVAYDVRVHVPADRPHRVPLVLDLHGSGADGATQSAVSGLDAVADENGFVVVEPTAAIASNGGWAWNVPGVPTTAGPAPPAGARDDVAFLRA